MKLNLLDRKSHKNKSRKLSRPVKHYMQRHFGLLPEYLGLLRCFDNETYMVGKRVNYISIFNPYKAREEHFIIETKSDLDRHPELLEYEGYID